MNRTLDLDIKNNVSHRNPYLVENEAWLSKNIQQPFQIMALT